MPISSGANDWPKEYAVRPPPSPQGAKVVVVPRPTTPIIARPAPDHTPQVLVIDQPPATTVVQARPPSPQRIVYIDAPQASRPPPMSPQKIQVVESVIGPRRPQPVYGSYPNYNSYPPRGNGCFPDPYCCADPYFTTGMAGANAGCCQGGMFGSRKYPFHPSQNYVMKGTGRGRCCACIWGTILGLASLALLLGMLLGYLPTTQISTAKTTVTNQYPGGYWYNGVYYYPITNAPDVFYYNLGPGIPCNQYSNNSNIPAPATAGYTELVSDATGIITATVPAGTTGTTLPDCDKVTTSFVLAAGVSVPTTTLKWQVSGATTNSWSTLMHYIAMLSTTLFACLLTSF